MKILLITLKTCSHFTIAFSTCLVMYLSIHIFKIDLLENMVNIFKIVLLEDVVNIVLQTPLLLCNFFLDIYVARCILKTSVILKGVLPAILLFQAEARAVAPRFGVDWGRLSSGV